MFILEKKMSKAEKQKLKNGGSYTVFRGKSNGHINANILFPSHTYSAKHVTSKPHVKHVTNVKQDVTVKLSRVAAEKQTLPPHLQHHHHHRQQQHQQQNNRHNMYLPGYRVKSAPYPPVDYNANSTKLREGTHLDAMSNGNHTTTTSARHGRSPMNTVSNGGSHYMQDKHSYVDQNKSESDTSFKSDNDSLTEQQDQVISTLDDTLKSFTMDDSDSDDKDVPTIVADILPYGVYESFNMNDVNMDSSETAGTSRTSSISNESSINSRTSIIARRRDNDEGSRKTSNSVKFKLPEGHVDKPYSPMQVKSKQPQNNPGYREMGSPAFTTICFSDEKGKLWHTGNGVLVQDNVPKKRSGPFKGSFRGLFYGKYAEKDALINTDSFKSKTPQFLHTIDSFESLSLEGEKIESKGSLTRRNTFHFK